MVKNVYVIMILDQIIYYLMRIIDEYCDFIYLLEDSSGKIEHEFGEDILKLYGIKNNKKDFIEKGRKEIITRRI